MKKFATVFLTITSVMLLAFPVFAQSKSVQTADSIVALGAALCMGLAAFGGALGQSRTAVAALEGIARNPQAAGKVQTPMIIALAMTESLVLFAFVIAFFLQGKFSA